MYKSVDNAEFKIFCEYVDNLKQCIHTLIHTCRKAQNLENFHMYTHSQRLLQILLNLQNNQKHIRKPIYRWLSIEDQRKSHNEYYKQGEYLRYEYQIPKG